MPGLSREYVAASVPDIAANVVAPSDVEREGISDCNAASRRELYSLPPSRCCSWGKPRLKATLKSLPDEDAHGNVQPIRRLYACSFARGARDTAESVTSWLARWTTKPSNPPAIAEQDAHPAAYTGPHMNWENR